NSRWFLRTSVILLLTSSKPATLMYTLGINFNCQVSVEKGSLLQVPLERHFPGGQVHSL
ncbi:hypothetical protein B0F90DRAFT_1656025, partial [Multifurca ochricompacta]